MLSRLIIPSLSALVLLASCERETQVERANREGILLFGNSNEPKGLDPQVVSGVLESNILRALCEGLVTDHPSEDATYGYGGAESLEPDETSTVWTARLRRNARWSDGEPVTARDYTFSYQRILTPSFGAKYAEMLYFLDGAQEFNRGFRGRILFERTPRDGDPAWQELAAVGFQPDESIPAEALEAIAGKSWDELDPAGRRLWARSRGLDGLKQAELEWIAEDPAGRFVWPDGFAHAELVLARLISSFDEDLWKLARVGVEALDDFTLRLTLRGPTPYFPQLLKHYTWFPVPKHVVLKHGTMTQKGNRWAKFGNFVSNGPFQLKSWRINDHLEVERNPHYWNAAAVTLNGVRFLPINNSYTEARMFRNGQLHQTYSAPPEMVDLMERENPEILRQEPYVGTMFYRCNTTREPLNDPRVRRALNLAIQQSDLCEKVMRGFLPASGMTPPMDGYETPNVVSHDPEQARRLLAEAGFPGGKGFPRMKILIASRETAATMAQAVQAMWRQELGIETEIENKEWTAYLAAMQGLDYDFAASGWIGDYLDPLTFLEMWTTGNGNNMTGWSNAEFEELLKQSHQEADPAKRYAILNQAERILLEDSPTLLIAWYARNYFLDPAVEGWYPLLLDNHPFQSLRLRTK